MLSSLEMAGQSLLTCGAFKVLQTELSLKNFVGIPFAATLLIGGFSGMFSTALLYPI